MGRKARRKKPKAKAKGVKKTVLDATVTYFDKDGGKFMVLSYKNSQPDVTVLFEVKEKEGRLEQLEVWNLALKPEQALDWHRNRMSMMLAGIAVGPMLLSGKKGLKGLKDLMRRAKAAGK